MRKPLGLLIAIIAITGFVTLSPAEADPNKRLSDVERNACIAKGGSVATFGLLNGEGCVLPMKDAGKLCTDGSQCDGGTCFLDDRKPGFKAPSRGQKVVGQCAATNFTFGCGWRVHEGQTSVPMCVD